MREEMGLKNEFVHKFSENVEATSKFWVLEW